MIVRRLEDCEEIVALDGTVLRELLNPLHAKKKVHLDYSIAHAIVRPGESSMPHRFFEASEVYYILSGKGRMYVDEEEAEVDPGDTVYIPPRKVQYIENTGQEDLIFLCIVSPSWFPEAEELIE
ncbi:MAG: cupin domain-containing protein [Candidatus Thorarchaeota archaeon]|nr:cupin domain-containing protein [Candidatus Thorarchaeota archaeon]